MDNLVIERTGDSPSTGPSDDWVGELIALTRPGLEINLCVRATFDRVIPFQYDDFD